jgi:hypothetical protein
MPSDDEIIIAKEIIIVAKEIRAESLDFLEPRGFVFLEEFPLPNLERELRPPEEVLGRAMAMQTLFLYVALDEAQEASSSLQEHASHHDLHAHWTPEEATVFALPRAQATTQYQAQVGWLLEGLWSLVWVLGYPQKPQIEAQEISATLTQEIMLTFLPQIGSHEKDFFHAHTLRHVDEVITLEDRFFCAYRTYLQAKTGLFALPPSFQEPFYGSILSERQQALQWCLSPQEKWGTQKLHL